MGSGMGLLVIGASAAPTDQMARSGIMPSRIQIRINPPDIRFWEVIIPELRSPARYCCGCYAARPNRLLTMPLLSLYRLFAVSSDHGEGQIPRYRAFPFTGLGLRGRTSLG